MDTTRDLLLTASANRFSFPNPHRIKAHIYICLLNNMLFLLAIGYGLIISTFSMTAITFLAPAGVIMYFKLIEHSPSSSMLSDIGFIYRTTSTIFDPTPIGPHELSPGPVGSLSLQILHDGTIVLVLDRPGNIEQPWAIAVDPKSIRPADPPLVFHPFDIGAPPSLSGFTSSPTVKYASHDSNSHAAPSAFPYSAAVFFF
jgi:hypothetical protein